MANRTTTTAPQLTPLQALELARNSDGPPPPSAQAALEAAIAELWARILTQPTSYIMNSSEFAVFNYYRTRFETSEVARNAVARFWDHFQGQPSSMDGWRS